MLALLLLSLASPQPVTAGPVAEPAIVGGVVHDGDPAVVFVEPGCTATVIAPRVVLAAAHCFEGNLPTTVKFVNDGDDSGVEIEVIDAAAPGFADLAVGPLAESAPVAPRTYNATPLAALVGQPVRLVGFGATSETAELDLRKRVGLSELVSVTPGEVLGMQVDEMATTNDRSGTCYSDSGGPNFMTVGGEEVVVGVTARGSDNAFGEDNPCGVGFDIAVRTDAHAAFIGDFVVAAEMAPAAARVDAVGCQMTGFSGGGAVWATLALLGLALAGRGHRRAAAVTENVAVRHGAVDREAEDVDGAG